MGPGVTELLETFVTLADYDTNSILAILSYYYIYHIYIIIQYLEVVQELLGMSEM